MIEIFLYSFLTNFFYYCLGCLILSRNNITNYSLFYKALIGVITGSFIALLLNFFTPLSKNINSFLFILVILIFLIKLHITIKKKEIIFLIISTLLSFFLILYSNINRPDAGLYHLPFIGILNEYKIIFGLNNLHFRFGHVSIIQYLSALNNNYFFEEKGIIIPLACVVSFFYIYFSNEVLKIYKKKSKIDTNSLFSLSILIYISFKINSYDGFGNDAVAHLSFFYLISHVLKLEKKNIDILPIFLLSVFIFLNKSTMIFAFIIPIFITFFKHRLQLKKIFILIISFPSIFLLLWLLKNFITSGCAIYPVVITCIDVLPWLNIETTNADSTASEAWSKAWPENKNPNLPMEIFIKDFNWVFAWSKKHLVYIANIIIPYTLLLLILFLILKHKTKKINNKVFSIKLPKFYWLIFSTCFVGVLFFLIKFPLYRYGYSYVLSLIILLFIYFFKKNIVQKKIIIICKLIFILAILSFIGKQGIRYIKSYNLIYIDKPWPRIYSFNTNEKIITQKKYLKNDFYYYLSTNSECMLSSPPCTNYKIDEKLIYKRTLGYILLVYKFKLS